MRLPIPPLLILFCSLPDSRTGSKPDVYEDGRRQYAVGEYHGAITAFREALRTDKTLGEAWYWLGMGYLQSRNYRDAKQQLRHMTVRPSTDARSYRGLGMVFLKDRNRALHSGMRSSSTRAILKAII